ncbi:hypothetical protein [Rhodococcus erythropolis]|uniref:hypothetical protein n=1 Tax=Rhodococcus erythropolis TaxID=1833 RepID=UPI001C9A61E5|nr:hypothetical protein [Rhodococcus erythropolis]
MREYLGIAIDDDFVSTALVDADAPLLGAIDAFGRRWGEAGTVPSTSASARALTSAAAIATERASRAELHPATVGVVCERVDVSARVPDALSGFSFENVELVDGLDARMAYLHSVDALAGAGTCLAVWSDGDESVLAAIDPALGEVNWAHRYITDEVFVSDDMCSGTVKSMVSELDPVPSILVAMGTTDAVRRMCAEAAERSGMGFIYLGERAQLAIGAALVAASARAGDDRVLTGGVGAGSAPERRFRPVMVWPILLILTGLLIGLLFTLTPKGISTSTPDRSKDTVVPSTLHYTPRSPMAGEQQPRQEQSGSPSASGTPPLVGALPPCDPVVEVTPAALHRSDPDDGPSTTAIPTTAIPTTDNHPDPTCIPLRQG